MDENVSIDSVYVMDITIATMVRTKEDDAMNVNIIMADVNISAGIHRTAPNVNVTSDGVHLTTVSVAKTKTNAYTVTDIVNIFVKIRKADTVAHAPPVIN
jgi:hypothetical protein